ncbi:MAG: hypothetical protein U1E56_13375 [Bauldia sp.]
MALVAGRPDIVERRPLPWPALGIAALGAIAGALHLALPLNHDAAWMLEGAGRLLDGGAFGREIVDVNPPLSWWIGMVPAALARASGLAPAAAFVAFVLALAGASLLLTARLLALAGTPSETRGGILLATAAVLLIAPGYDFGQREHTMLIVAVPYAVLAALRREAVPLAAGLAFGVGAFAALGFCLKPHFLLVPALLEVWLLMATRRWLGWFRAETAVLGLLALAYLAAIRLFAPDYLAQVLPDALAGYWAYNSDLLTVIVAVARDTLPALAVTGLLVAVGGGRPAPLTMALLVAAAGATLGALAQLKGWPYHLLPAAGLIAVAGLSQAALTGRPAAAGGAYLGAVGFFLVLIAMPSLRLATDTAAGGRVAALTQAMRQHAAADETVYAFVTSPRDVHPAALAAGRHFAYTSCCLHLVPAATRLGEVAPGEAARVNAVAEAQAADLVAALRRKPPAVILVDAAPEKLGFAGRFDYLDWFARVPGFDAFWAGYAESAAVDSYRVFHRRRD